MESVLNSMIKGSLLILLASTNTVSSTKIVNLVVPEVVQSGTDVILDCQYYVPDGNFVLQWLFNGNNTSVYKWSPLHKMPEVTGILEEHLDLFLNSSRTLKLADEGRKLRLVRVEPHLSGEYTCVLESKGVVTRETKSMLVYSTEQELDLNVNVVNEGVINIACVARGVYPQPDLILEYHNEPISQQYQRVWRDINLLYVTECTTQLVISKCRDTNIEVKCRLSIPQVDYIAIKKRYLLLEADDCNFARYQNPPKLSVLVAITFFLVMVEF
ncbi:unnamed protein product [Chilo suppressalis]|uniref:Ig-like domain-containing protein n=1 Tax=Chilo suppressalis TaxID=168631 RepID=A0ABN8BC98_CHISP|nr:hypothetical protein evm_003426 [Chilo suppressalis]CAH0406998.1 unnamed protein product [Chilo suppressalis]